VRSADIHASFAIAASLVLALGVAPGDARAGQAACTGVAECRAQTEAAIAQGDFERAHDLAWRTAQQGPRNDRALMFLLARTQALSNRPDDALVMIRRIAETGALVDVSGDEFARVRELPGWPAVEAVIAGVANPPVASASARGESVELRRDKPVAPEPAPKASASARSEPVELRRDKPVAPLAPPAPMAPVAPLAPMALVEEAGRFTSAAFAPGGLACDAVSKRFVFGDRPGRKLLILAEGSDHSIDLTRADVAGFLDVAALDIDTTNGNLWVASAEADGRGATLHRLQLISGRHIASYPVPDALAPAQPVDVVTTPSGVLVLDAAQRRVLVLRAGAESLTLLTGLGDIVPLSLTAGRQDTVAYVTHRDGVVAIDLRTRTVAPVTAPKAVALGGIERLRRHATGFVAVQALPDGSRRLVRLTLDATGRRVARLQVIDVAMAAGAAPVPLAVCGDAAAFLVGEDGGSAVPQETAWTIRRVRLNP
jgi:hypothetical protein